MANNKRKPTPSVFGKANLMDEILSGAPAANKTSATGAPESEKTAASGKVNGETKSPTQAEAVESRTQTRELPEESPSKSRAGQGSDAEAKLQDVIDKTSFENDSNHISGNSISNGNEKNAESSAERERNILPDSNKEHVDFLFSIDLVDKMEEVFPRLRRQMPTGQRRAFSKSAFVEMCVAEILWDFKQAGDASLLNRMVKQFAEELSERRAGQEVNLRKH